MYRTIKFFVGRTLAIIAFGMMPVCIIISLIFYDTTLIQFIAMLLIALLDIALLLCSSHQNCYGFIKTEKGKVYFDIFYYDGAFLCLFSAFCFFCPVFDVW